MNSSNKNIIVDLFKDIYFSPLYIKSLVKIIIKLIPSKKIGIFNIGSRDKISKSNFILLVAKKLKIKLRYNLINYSEFKKTNTKRPKNMSMNIKKFEKEFNIKLPYVKNEIKKLTIK